MSLSEWNIEFERGGPVPPEAWDRWLWHSDLHEKLTADVMLNSTHLLGLLIARYRARTQPATMDIRLSELWPHFVHGSTIVRGLTLRQLRDSLEDLQMHFPDYSADWDGVSCALDALMARFGQICLTKHEKAVMDDVASLDPLTGQLSLPFIRRTTALLTVLYRHVYLASVAVDLPGAAFNDVVENCHIQAGLDSFHKHMMHGDLPPSARIIYKQDFAGMYNCVTQVVYFHFHNYERKLQLPLEAIRRGDQALACLSVALELEPDIPVVHEDELLPPTWAWILMAGGLLYLISPVGVEGTRTVYAGHIWTLLRERDSLLSKCVL